jgi:16S rRNA (cytosine967-C5)-methyltransferase
MVITQRAILSNAAGLVKPGGSIVYSTCTIEPEENTETIHWFLESHPNFELFPAESILPAEICKDGFLQTFPHKHHSDGAFAARLIRRQ